MSPSKKSLQLARRLISEECGKRGGAVTDTNGRAAFRVCEKLRPPLSKLTGAAGFHALLSRALSLARQEAAWLSGLEITPQGSLTFRPEVEALMAKDDVAEGGAALVAELLGLLITLIGEALTLRLLRDVWPKAALGD